MSKVALRRALVVMVGILVAALLPLAPVPAATAAGVGITVDGSQQMQTMTALGVNINPNSWDNGNLKPALDMLIDQAGVKSFRVAMDMIDWESTNDNSDPNNFNWNYYDPIYSGATSFDTRYAGSTEGAAQAVAGTGKDFWMSEYNVFDQSFPLLDQGASGLMVWEAYDSVYNHAIVNGLGSDPGNDSYGNTALIAYDAATKTYTPRSQFYDFAQLFKFVSVGAARIGASSGNAGVKVEAFGDPATSRLTIVGENNSSAAQTLTLSLNNLDAVPSSLQYYQTNSGSDLAQGADVT